MSHQSYAGRPKALVLQSLELRRLQHDLICTYKVSFGKLSVDHANMIIDHYHTTRNYQGAPWKLYPNYCRNNLRKHFFCERVIARWNLLNITTETVHSVAAFKCLVYRSDLFAYSALFIAFYMPWYLTVVVIR